MMDGFTLVDAGVALVIFLSAILAYSRGLVREILSIAGWVIAAVTAFMFAPSIEPLMHIIPVFELPKIGIVDIGGFLSSNCKISIIAAFTTVFAIALILVSIFTPIFSSLVQGSILGSADRGLGFIFGVIRGFVLVIVALIAYSFFGQSMEIVELSMTKHILSEAANNTQDMIPTEVPDWILQQFESLMGSCEAPKTPTGTIAN